MLRKRCIFYFVFLSTVIASIIACKSPKKVHFPEKVDTKSKPILMQTKKTFASDGTGLYISNEFDGARLNGIEMVNDSTVRLKIYPENAPINNSAYYAFKIWTDQPDNYYLSFDYPKGFNHRYWPKIKSSKTWTPADSSDVFISDTGTVLNLEVNSTPTYVAAQKVVNSKDVYNWYSELVNGKESKIETHNFGQSTLGRDLAVMEIGIGPSNGKDVVILLTRQHPPETTGYFAFQSFLETIIEDSDLTESFLKHYTVLAFPLMNPDGVDLGHWRHNAGGVDLNRDWSVYNQPEIRQTIKFIEKYLKKNNSKLILGLDFHSTWHDVYYTNEIREGTTVPNFIDDWFEALESNIPGYKVNEASSNSNRPVSKGWFLYGQNAVGITFEIGDNTPMDQIDLIGRVSAEQMMNILLNEIN